MNGPEWGQLVCLSVLWGGAFFCAGAAVQDVPPLTAVFGTALAYIVFFRLLVSAGASNVMLVTLLIPVTAMALGALFLGEAVKPWELSGAAVIGLGLVFIDGRLPRRLGLGGRLYP